MMAVDGTLVKTTLPSGVAPLRAYICPPSIRRSVRAASGAVAAAGRSYRQPVSFRDPDARPRERPRGRGARPGVPDAPEPAAPVAPTLPPAERQMSCVLQDQKLTGCRFDHPAAAALIGRDAARLLQQVEGTQMFAPEGTVMEGQVFYSINAFIRR